MRSVFSPKNVQVCWAFFSLVTAADCLRLLCVCVFGIKCTVEKFGLWCALSANSVSVHTANFSHTFALMLILNFPSGMLITLTALLYFSWTAIFLPLFEPSLLKLNSETLTLSPTLNIFFYLFFALACSVIFSRNLRNLVFVKVHPSLYAHTHTCRDFQFPW